MSVLLIVPAYNESQRLKLEDFLTLPAGVCLLFADDGSSDQTPQLIARLTQQNHFCYSYRSEKNVGKAQIIYQAMAHANKIGLTDKFDWVGYWDADLATPFFEVTNMLFNADLSSVKYDAVWGARIYRLGADIKRCPMRHYLGRGFATVTSLALNLKAYDTQCGAKIFRKDCAKLIFDRPFMSRWIFDIELYLRADKINMKILEYPLTQWHDIPGSKLKVWKEIFRVAYDILRIRKAYHS
jgi:dolichyl-phosphate beta-glucosyltransferase